MAGFHRLRPPAVRVFDTIRCCSVIKILAVGFTFWCTYVTIGYVDTWTGTPTLWNSMDQVNDTFAQEIPQAPPENPMYAGGIAVLVAFVLFMYWGSLNEKDDPDGEEKEKKKIPNWLTRTHYNEKRKKKKKKRKGKQSGVYSVSDAMSKHLLADSDREKPCEQCARSQIHKHNLRKQTTSSSLNGEQLSTKPIQTNNKTAHSPNSNRIPLRDLRKVSQEERLGNGYRPSRKRANSSPDIFVTAPPEKKCTCVRSNQNGGKVERDGNVLTEAPANRGEKVTLVKFCELDCERTSELVADLHFEKETGNKFADRDKMCRNPPDPCNSVGTKTNGKVLRQLDDASVRLENHPDVAITILAESVM